MGGTFDPVHHGHLRMALELRERLGPAQIHMVPCQIPPHRAQPGASGEQRLAMLRAALAGEAGVVADDRELRQPGPSYTVDTLRRWRAEIGPDAPLAVMLGTDAFAGLDQWSRWEDIPELAHIIVVERPGYAVPNNSGAGRLMAERAVAREALWSRSCGCIWKTRLSRLDIAATDIRDRIGQGLSPRFLVPDAVWHYIREEGLYGIRKQRLHGMQKEG